jgi:hypothetical protein
MIDIPKGGITIIKNDELNEINDAREALREKIKDRDQEIDDWKDKVKLMKEILWKLHLSLNKPDVDAPNIWFEDGFLYIEIDGIRKQII